MARVTQAERAIVERIAAEEAGASRVAPHDVVMMSMKPAAIAARRRAWDRIRAETGWSRYRVSIVWGCDYQAVCQAPRGDSFTPYDARTVHQLRWLHGDERGDAILRGEDPATQQDIAAWNRLGRGQ